MKHQHSEYFIDMLINKIADLEKKVHDLETELLFTPKKEEEQKVFDYEESNPKIFNHSVLKELREKEGWTLRYMAEELGVDYSYLAKLEKDRVPSMKMARKIADLFRVSVKVFIT